tara:strand:- start:674 stop:1618 length:945 start_codon:yes stop_codon:yes gene_type:complete
MSKAEVTEFFDNHAESWVLNGYNDDGYNYPVALHRLRIIKKILSNFGSRLKIADLGCGGGNVSLALADLGHNVTGIDGADNMIELSNTLRSSASQEIQGRVEFECSPITDNQQESNTFDVCIAMGVIGYFEKDEELFNEVRRLLKPGGLFLVSCRNRLFNMQSISFRTANEINKNNAVYLIDEIKTLYERIPTDNVEDMLGRLNDVVSNLPNETAYDANEMLSPSDKGKDGTTYKPFFDPRQHTPNQLTNAAKNCGFDNLSYHGVHPHLIDPNLNKLLPPKIFNQISSCLEAFEDLPISLVWSSVFLGSFILSE